MLSYLDAWTLPWLCFPLYDIGRHLPVVLRAISDESDLLGPWLVWVYISAFLGRHSLGFFSSCGRDVIPFRSRIRAYLNAVHCVKPASVNRQPSTAVEHS